MRYLLMLAFLGVVREARAQQILIRRKILPPPTTFAELRQLPGPVPTGPCELAAVTLSPDSLVPIALTDSSAIRLPRDWHEMPGLAADLEAGRTVIAGPGESRLRIQRERNGAVGRPFQGDQNGDPVPGTTCVFDGGKAGAIWTFYAPDSVQSTWPRPYLAYGEFMTPLGFRYSLTLYARSSNEQARLAAILTAAELLPPS